MGDSGGGLGMIMMMISLFSLFVTVIFIAAGWRLFTKAGQPGWAAIVPIYNLYIMTQFLRMPVWTMLLLFVPIVNFLAIIVFTHRMVMAFGKDVMWTVGLIIPVTAPFVYLALAFGDSSYREINEFDMSTAGLK